VRYSLVIVGAVGDIWRSKTMTAPVDPVETIFWHCSPPSISSLYCHPPQRAELVGSGRHKMPTEAGVGD